MQAGYGLSNENPVLVGMEGVDMSPHASRRYLRRLRDGRGRPFKFIRVGNVGEGGHPGHIVDQYKLVGEDGSVRQIFIDAYHPEFSFDKTPIAEGFGEGPAPDGDPAEDRLERIIFDEARRFCIFVPDERWVQIRIKDASLAVQGWSGFGMVTVAAYAREMPEDGLDGLLKKLLAARLGTKSNPY